MFDIIVISSAVVWVLACGWFILMDTAKREKPE